MDFTFLDNTRQRWAIGVALRATLATHWLLRPALRKITALSQRTPTMADDLVARMPRKTYLVLLLALAAHLGALALDTTDKQHLITSRVSITALILQIVIRGDTLLRGRRDFRTAGDGRKASRMIVCFMMRLVPWGDRLPDGARRLRLQHYGAGGQPRHRHRHRRSRGRAGGAGHPGRFVRVELIGEVITAQAAVAFERAHLFNFAEWSVDFEVVYHFQSPDYIAHMDAQQAILFEICRRFERQQLRFAHPLSIVHLADAERMGKSPAVHPVPAAVRL